jgi:hypothetical protein
MKQTLSLCYRYYGNGKPAKGQKHMWINQTMFKMHGQRYSAHIKEQIDARGANIQKARQDIEDARWVSNNPRVPGGMFDDFCNKIQKANNELHRYNANVDGRTQVLDFLKGIRDDGRVNPHLLAIKTTVLTSPETMADLDKAVIMFKDTMWWIMSSSSDREQRQISAAQHGGYQGRYNN